MSGNGDFPVFTPDVVSEIHGGEDANSVGALIGAGNTIQQIRTSYMTAVGVQKKRDLAEIVKKCEQEAQYAGDSLWYGWKQGGKEISGETIGLAMIVARNWGNCASEAFVVEDKPSHYMVSASFIDLESGSTITRPFKQNKNRKLSDKQKANPEEIARQEDITLQIAVSKAMRNAVLAATPGWLHARMIEKAKAAIADGLVGDKLKKAIAATIHQFQDKFGVTEEMLVDYVGKPSSGWVADNLLDLKGVYNALKEGRTRAADVFVPNAEQAPAQETKTEPATAKESKPVETAQQTDTPEGRNPDPAPFVREDAIKTIREIYHEMFGTETAKINAAIARWTEDEDCATVAKLYTAPDEVVQVALVNSQAHFADWKSKGGQPNKSGKLNI